MITIIFESHGTTTDNEKHLASGWADVELSELGIQQSKEMGKRYIDENFDVIFCSNLERSYKSAEITGNPHLPPRFTRRLTYYFGLFIVRLSFPGLSAGMSERTFGSAYNFSQNKTTSCEADLK